MSTMSLMREVRFSLTDPDTPAAGANSWAGAPASDRFDPYLTARTVISGRVDPQTGYICNVKQIDELVRRRIVAPLQASAAAPGPAPPIAPQMRALWDAIASDTPAGTTLESLELAPTPHLSFSIERGDTRMVRMTYAFEFSAAHRLYTDRLSEDENRRTFGKCANPNGHGHNYVVNVTLKGVPNEMTGSLFPLGDFEHIVNERVVNPFDHKHLNLDVPEFADSNPSVENITRVIFNRLKDAFAPATLAAVRVYETPKTYAEYRGES